MHANAWDSFVRRWHFSVYIMEGETPVLRASLASQGKRSSQQPFGVFAPPFYKGGYIPPFYKGSYNPKAATRVGRLVVCGLGLMLAVFKFPSDGGAGDLFSVRRKLFVRWLSV